MQKKQGAWHVLLIQHRAAGYWGFPKGRPEKDETAEETAIRELREETGLEVVHFISDKSFNEQYFFHHRGKHVSKTVSFFIAEVTGDVILQINEVCAAQWVLLSRADQVLTYNNDKTVIREALSLLGTKEP